MAYNTEQFHKHAYEINEQDGSPEKPYLDSVMTRKQAIESILEKDPACPTEIIERQEIVPVQYYSFDGKVHEGQIVVDKDLEDDIKKIFFAAFETKFPIARVIPIAQFGWDDETSMSRTNNNSSGFNYRSIEGKNELSNHARGRAIDLNPFYNPWIKEGVSNQPVDGVYDPESADSSQRAGTLTPDHLIVKTARELGWEWGGDWDEGVVDYQHFEKIDPKKV